MDCSVAGVTVRTAVLEVTPVKEAVMLLVPVPTPVAKPELLMVATVVVAEFQVTEPLIFAWLESLYVPVAVNCCIVPLAIDGFAGVTAMDCRKTPVIVNVCAEEAFPEVVSVTVMPKVYGLPWNELGVPLITPVDGFNPRPGGSAPELSDHCKVDWFPPTSPIATLYAVPTLPPGRLAGTT